MSTSSRSQLYIFYSLYLLSLLVPIDAAVSFIADIQPNEEECFAIRIPLGNKNRSYNSNSSNNNNALLYPKFLRFNYELLHDEDEVSPEPLYVFLMDPSEKALYEARGRTRDKVQVPVEEGQRYWLCLQNDHDSDEDTRHDGIERSVGFTYSIYQPYAEQLAAQNEQILTQHREHLTLADAIQGTLRDVLSHQDFMRTREGQQRALTEGTFTKLLTWTLCQVAVVGAMAAIQVMYIRRMIEHKVRMLF